MSLRSLGFALLACFASLSTSASLAAQSPESLLHDAYFLERERGDLAAALALYQRVQASSGASPELQAEAKAHADALTEDLASQDLARLMPPQSIAYIELAQPGEALFGLLEQLGLVGTLQEA